MMMLWGQVGSCRGFLDLGGIKVAEILEISMVGK
jgi:hypothetical protein